MPRALMGWLRMSDLHLTSMDEQGHRLAAAFCRAEAKPSAMRRPRWRIAIPAIAAAAVIVAGILLSGGRGANVPALTTEEAVADVAQATTNAKPLGPRQFLYTKSTDSQLWSYERTIDALGRLVAPTAVIASQTKSTWINLKTPGRFTATDNPLRFPTPGDKARAKQQIAASKNRSQRSARVQTRIRETSRKTGLSSSSYPIFVSEAGIFPRAGVLESQGTFLIAGSILTPAQLKKFPTDPRVIYRTIHDGIAAGNAKFVARQRAKGRARPQTIDPDIGVWDAITTPMLWFNLPLPPEVRANLVRALGEIPEVRSAPDEKDPRGRRGIALTLDLQGSKRVAIFDPETGLLLSLKTVLSDPKQAAKFNHQEDLGRLPTGTVQREYVLLESRVTNKLPDVKNPDGPISRFRQGL